MKKNIIKLVSDIYPRPVADVPDPKIFSNNCNVILTYNIDEESTAILKFPLCHIYKSGHPNDEALDGHKLYSNGLNFYDVHEVSNSTWINELEKSNSVHPNHSKESFLENLKHLIFTFHDSTFECIITESDLFKTEILFSKSYEEYLEILMKNIFLNERSM